MQAAFFPARGEWHYATEMRPTQNIASSEQSITINDDVTDIDDCLGCNICAFFCCCWLLGCVGIIFSAACDSAKSAGNRAYAECYSLLAKAMCVSSAIFGIVFAVFILIFGQNYY